MITVLHANHLFLVPSVALAVIWKHPLEVPLFLKQQAVQFSVLPASRLAPHTLPWLMDTALVNLEMAVAPSFSCTMGGGQQVFAVFPPLLCDTLLKGHQNFL